MAEWIIDKNDVNATIDGNFMLYKNRPIVREDNIIVYGNLEDKYYSQMIIMSMKEFKGKQVPDQIYIQLISTDESLPVANKVAKEGMKSGLNEALEIATIWLDRYLA